MAVNSVVCYTVPASEGCLGGTPYTHTHSPNLTDIESGQVCVPQAHVRRAAAAATAATGAVWPVTDRKSVHC